MDRLNSEGIPRDQLAFALKDRPSVNLARKIDSCLLCRRGKVNEAGLCKVCWASLTDDEFRIAQKWTMGVGP